MMQSNSSFVVVVSAVLLCLIGTRALAGSCNIVSFGERPVVAAQRQCLLNCGGNYGHLVAGNVDMTGINTFVLLQCGFGEPMATCNTGTTSPGLRCTDSDYLYFNSGGACLCGAGGSGVLFDASCSCDD